MKSIDQIKEYLETHWFKSRHHAFYIRGYLLTEYPEEKGFNFKYVYSISYNGCSVEGEPITATDAIKFIEDEI
jgi:hypothetical protein